MASTFRLSQPRSVAGWAGSDNLDRLLCHRLLPVVAHEHAGLGHLALNAGHDHVEGTRPGLLGVPDRRPGRMVRVAVVVAEDLIAGVVDFAFDPAVLIRVDPVGVAGPVLDVIGRPHGAGHCGSALAADEHAADLVRVTLGGMSVDGFESAARDLQPLPRRWRYRPPER